MSQAASQGPEAPWFDTQVAATGPLTSVLDLTTERVVSDLEADGFADIELDAEMPRSLWEQLLYSSLARRFSGREADLRHRLEAAATVRLGCVTDVADDTKLVVLLYVGDTYVGEEDHWRFFLDWDAVALRWLIHELGVDEADIDAALKRAMA